MYYIVLGCLGFLTIHLFDIVALKKSSLLKPVTWASGCAVLVYSIVRLFLGEQRFAVPFSVSLTGWILLIFSAAMLAWSLFINLPFRKTYVSPGIGDRLVTTGLYALVRHPGVHWFSLAMVALALIAGSVQMLIAVPVFIGLDVVLVFVQDRWVFPRMFRDYPQYRQVTPMLIPNRHSLKAFINSLT